tara:strand:- start:24 stop:1469 length:1446 start_codon:yes stop_codon:yes gene_type:complete
MAFPVIGGTQLSGYEINNSLRFTDGDSAYLNRLPSSAGNQQTWTWSSWIKFGNLDNDTSADVIFSAYTGSGYNIIRFEDKQLDYLDYDGTDVKSVSTNRLFRDISAWYHIVVAIDMTQSTDSNRVKIYVNGVQETSFATATYQPQNQNTLVNSAVNHYVGRESGNYYDGYIAAAYLIDGQALTPTDFGETDDNGVWIPKNYTGSYGTNGFKLEFKQLGTAADATSIGADTSGNNNHFSQTNVTPAVDRTVDTPTNNWCTLNPLDQSNSYAQNDATRGTFSEGNCNFSSAGAIGGSERYYNTTGTIAIPSSGKWYWEAKPNNGTNGLGFRWTMGFLASNHGWSNSNFTEWTEAQGQRGAYKADGTVWYNNSQISSGHATPSVNDIISFKYDADNRDFFVAVNGTYINSGNAVLTSSNITATDFLLIFLQNGSDGDVATAMNFGNAPFSISSGNSDANGYGNFEYAVPANYYSLCSKNLAEYG